MMLPVVPRLFLRVIPLLAPSILLGSAASAQTSAVPESLPTGTRIRLETAPSSVVLGDVVRMTPDSIVFREHLSRSTLALALPQVRTLERSAGHPGIRGTAVKLAIIGGVVGAAVGFQVSGYDPCTDATCRPSRVGMTLGVGALFAAVGAFTGGVITPERWETVLDRRPH